MDWQKLVLDISHHQEISPDLSGARKAGYCGIIHKATEGLSVKAIDQKYGARRFLAGQQNMLWGCYHFLRPGDMKAQVEWFLKYAKPDDNTLVALDHEDKRCSLDMAQEFMEYAESKLNRPLILYSGHVIREQLERAYPKTVHPFFSKRRLWHAQYSKNFKVHMTWAEPWLWQISETGRVAGIKPSVDINVYRGDESVLRPRWLPERIFA